MPLCDIPWHEPPPPRPRRLAKTLAASDPLPREGAANRTSQAEEHELTAGKAPTTTALTDFSYRIASQVYKCEGLSCLVFIDIVG